MGTMKMRWIALLVWLRVIPRPDLVAQIVSEHPRRECIEPGFIYIVEGQGYKKWAYFRCPADENEIIQLSLMERQRPRWDITIDWLNRPTVQPSVRQLEGSYAHFWIKKGSLEWCEDSGRRPLFPGTLYDVRG